MNKLHITIAGAGYVGLSLATLLARHHFVTLLDPLEHKVDMINKRISPIKDVRIEQFFKADTRIDDYFKTSIFTDEYFEPYHLLDLVATTDKSTAYKNADL